MLRAEKISFAYDRVVVDEISLQLQAGELLAIVGPNGSGKSTLVRLLSGLLKPTQGTIEIDQRNINKISRRELAQMLGYVAQETRVQFPLTAFEFVLQGRFAYGRGLGFEQDTDLAAAEKALALTDTAQFYHRYLNALSGGERQRVFLARALAQQPRFLLLDEPTSNLDISHQVSTLKLLHKLTRESSLGVLLITHELNLAAEFADRVLLLKNGKRLALGSPLEVLTREKLEQLFETSLMVDLNPDSGAPRITIRAK